MAVNDRISVKSHTFAVNSRRSTLRICCYANRNRNQLGTVMSGISVLEPKSEILKRRDALVNSLRKLLPARSIVEDEAGPPHLRD